MATTNIPPGRSPAPPGSGVAYVGPRYKGKKTGYLYDPRTDKYYPDPKFTQSLTGEKPPGLVDQLIPVAAVGGTGLLAHEVGKDVYGAVKEPFINNIYNPIKEAGRGLLGLDSAPTVVEPGPTAATAATPSVVPTNIPNISTAPATTSSPYPVASGVDGGTILSDGTSLPGTTAPVEGGFGLMDALPYAALAHAGWNTAYGFGGDKESFKEIAPTALEAALAGWAVGGPFGALAGLAPIASGLISSGRSGSHEERSNQRQYLKDTQPNFLDESGNITLSSGDKFDIGKEREKGRAYYEGLLSGVPEEERGAAIGAANPIGLIASGGNKQIGTNFAGNIAAGFTQSGDTAEDFNREARNQYDKLGINEKEAYNILNEQAQKGVITPEELAAYHNSVSQAFHGNKGLLA